MPDFFRAMTEAGVAVDVTLYEGARHELLNETIRETVTADIVEWPSDKDFSGDLLLSIEVDVRPELTLPDLAGIAITVDAAEIADADVDAELDKLRSRCRRALRRASSPARKFRMAQTPW